jgi:hypothetical protein
MATSKDTTTTKTPKNTSSKPKKDITVEPASQKTTDSASSVLDDQKTMILLSHALGLIASFVAPLIIYLITEDALVKKHAKAALNFQISLAIYAFVFIIVGGFILFILTILTFGLFGVLFLLMPFILFVAWLVPPVVATVKANDDLEDVHDYPLTIKFIG